MKKCVSIIMALIFFCGTIMLSIQAQAAVSLVPIGLNYTVKDVDVGNSFTLRATVPQDSMIYMRVTLINPAENFSAITWVDHLVVEKV